jgi:hypothetical protein
MIVCPVGRPMKTNRVATGRQGFHISPLQIIISLSCRPGPPRKLSTTHFRFLDEPKGQVRDGITLCWMSILSGVFRAVLPRVASYDLQIYNVDSSPDMLVDIDSYSLSIAIKNESVFAWLSHSTHKWIYFASTGNPLHSSKYFLKYD